jgi:arginine exporter protein ArgO
MGIFMIAKILRILITAIISSLVLFTIGVAIWFFRKESQTSLKDILFIIGAIPLISIKGRGDFSYLYSKTVIKKSSDKRKHQDINDNKLNTIFGLNGILSGIIVWLIIYFI